MNEVKKGVVLAAGFGTRFMPFAKSVSKVMLPIIDTPTIEMIVDELVQSGIEEILIVVGFNKQIVINHFTQNKVLEKKFENKPDYLHLITKQQKVKISFVEQKTVNGTGGALLHAKKFVGNDPFVMTFSDDLMRSEVPVAKQLIDVYHKTGKMVLGCQRVTKQQVTKYCSVNYNKKQGNTYYVTDVVEKPKLEDVRSTLSCLGRYVFTPKIFNYLKNLKPNPQSGELCLTDTFTPIAEHEGLVAHVFDAVRYDIGDKFGYLTAVVDYALENEEYSKRLKDHLKKKL